MMGVIFATARICSASSSGPVQVDGNLAVDPELRRGAESLGKAHRGPGSDTALATKWWSSYYYAQTSKR
jgi:hypothetical protein